MAGKVRDRVGEPLLEGPPPGQALSLSNDRPDVSLQDTRQKRVPFGPFVRWILPHEYLLKNSKLTYGVIETPSSTPTRGLLNQPANI